jgi:sporulation protein YlmC with PRC-barrel domain
MTAGRTLWAGMRILDRQLVTNDARLAGCVDDLELTPSEDGNELYVTAILSGPGALAYRMRAHRLGSWLRRAYALLAPEGKTDPTRIPFNVVSDIGSHIALGCPHDEVGSALVERWTRDHVIAHVPGAGHEPE